ncbi:MULTISPECIES: hypothetical protein [Streptomyces]|uniref:hypothetical protein n=1 Tax=Streptomyces TaxID=1883 RepID=UPI00167C2CFC|nr:MULTISPECIES: hypothetical protein [Streptomyces]MBK3527153.1 hypothetical protein [Streptomyces sp. MBT70]GGR73342.1 hypothetical protein GCM10010236_29650 [Streptomyces eurythermus]
MNHSTRIAAPLAVAAVVLAAAYGTAHAARHTLAPAQQRATVTSPAVSAGTSPANSSAVSPADEHDPKEDVELDENGRPDVGED